MKKPFTKTILFCSLLFFVSNSLAKTSPQKMPPTIVTPITIKAQVWQDKIQSVGSLSAFQGVVLKPEASGRITKIYFKSGQIVKKGAPLIQLNDTIIKAQLQKAQALAILDKLNYQRYLQLYQKHFYDKADLDKALATLKGAQADVAQYQAQLQQTLISAPFAGKIGLVKISIGDFVNEGITELVSLQQLNPLRVDFTVPGIYLREINNGDKVIVNINDQQYRGTIYAYDAAIDPDTRMLAVRAKIQNDRYKLLPGAFVTSSQSPSTVGNICVPVKPPDISCIWKPTS